MDAGSRESDDRARAERSAAVLADYTSQTRRQLRWYRLIVGSVVLAGLAGVTILWRRGEAAHTRLRAASHVAASVPLGPISADLRRAWQSPDATATGDPVSGATVVTYSEHTVTGRSAASGAPLWSFTRGDRSLCTVAQLAGKAVAIYRHQGNCDQLVALDAQRGDRVWQRTLDADGHAVAGTPRIITTPDTILVSTPDVIYAIQPGGDGCDPATGGCGADYWRYAPEDGCSILGVAAGSAGVLIGEHCPGGERLRLHDPYRGPDEASKFTAITWTVATSGRAPFPVMAGAPIAAVTGNRLITYSPDDGRVLHTATLPNPAHAGVDLQTRAGPIGQLLYDGRNCSLVRADGSIGWTLTTDGLPRSGPDAGLGYVSTGDAVSAIALDTGTVRARYPLPTRASGVPIRFGTGFLLAGPDQTTLYR